MNVFGFQGGKFELLSCVEHESDILIEDDGEYLLNWTKNPYGWSGMLCGYCLVIGSENSSISYQGKVLYTMPTMLTTHHWGTKQNLISKTLELIALGKRS